MMQVLRTQGLHPNVYPFILSIATAFPLAMHKARTAVLRRENRVYSAITRLKI